MTKYGLGSPGGYSKAEDPLDDNEFTHADFPGGTYAYNKGDTQNQGCDGEGEFVPVFGQFLLREKTGCVPTDTVGCPVEFATDLWNQATEPPSDPERSFFGNARTIYGDVDITGDNTNDIRLWISVASSGQLNGKGLRFAIPGSPKTRVHWLDARTGGGGSFLCCNSDAPFNFCGAISAGRWTPYPIINSLEGDASSKINFPDFIFDGGPGTAFTTDESYVVAGTEHGVCDNQRRWGCLATEPTGCGTANNDLWCDCNFDRCNGTTDHCFDHPAIPCDSENNNPALDPCHVLPAANPGSCDLREVGWRMEESRLLSNDEPDPAQCGNAMYFWRGTPNINCSIAQVYAEDGDPTFDCSVRNYGPHVRPDQNCDGVDDVVPDLCPYYSEVDSLSDSNGDGRGDECQCGDSSPLHAREDGILVPTGDGFVNVSDIVATNILIFRDPMAGTLSEGQPGRFNLATPLCDATGEGDCTVSDIVADNVEIFSTNVSSDCPRDPFPRP